MATSIDFCARACVKLGASPIQTFDDVSVEAQTFATLYESIRDSELSNHFWNFNTFTTILSLDASAPNDVNYEYSYTLPADHMRSIDTYDEHGTSVDFLNEGGKILSNTTPLSLKYQGRPDESLFPPYFQSALVARLAAEAAEPIIGESGLKTAAWREYEAAAQKARKIDNQQNAPIQILGPNSSSWVKARTGWGW